mmetsp:Transcript_32348/g.52107  ORF Transcript_32348/g.52107 Transcript_32348/m.52107 type:complete len:397 (+) Transcript_32348:767-1957(+)
MPITVWSVPLSSNTPTNATCRACSTKIYGSSHTNSLRLCICSVSTGATALVALCESFSIRRRWRNKMPWRLRCSGFTGAISLVLLPAAREISCRRSTTWHGLPRTQSSSHALRASSTGMSSQAVSKILPTVCVISTPPSKWSKVPNSQSRRGLVLVSNTLQRAKLSPTLQAVTPTLQRASKIKRPGRYARMSMMSRRAAGLKARMRHAWWEGRRRRWACRRCHALQVPPCLLNRRRRMRRRRRRRKRRPMRRWRGWHRKKRRRWRRSVRIWLQLPWPWRQKWPKCSRKWRGMTRSKNHGMRAKLHGPPPISSNLPASHRRFAAIKLRARTTRHPSPQIAKWRVRARRRRMMVSIYRCCLVRNPKPTAARRQWPDREMAMLAMLWAITALHKWLPTI